jgi:uncharacterized protein YraI
MKKITIALLALLLGSPGIRAEVYSMVRVTGERVNLRARPNPQAEVVGQVAEGEFLIVKTFKNDWVEVLAPDKVDLWIHKEFVVDDTVIASTLNVRAGAGINYSVVGSLAKGDKVQVRGQFGDFLRIAPPSACSLWVSSSLVQEYRPDQPRASAAAEKPAAPSAAPATDAAPAGSRRAPPPASPRPLEQASAAAPAGPAAEGASASRPPPSDLDLIPLEGQGRIVQKDGVLRQVGFMFGRPASFRLVQDAGPNASTICYIRGNREQLMSFLGQRMTIRGRQYWVQGVRYPLVIPDQIIPQIEPAGSSAAH